MVPFWYNAVGNGLISYVLMLLNEFNIKSYLSVNGSIKDDRDILRSSHIERQRPHRKIPRHQCITHELTHRQTRPRRVTNIIRTIRTETEIIILLDFVCRIATEEGHPVFRCTVGFEAGVVGVLDGAEGMVHGCPFGYGPVEARKPGKVEGDVTGWTRVICKGKINYDLFDMPLGYLDTVS